MHSIKIKKKIVISCNTISMRFISFLTSSNLLIPIICIRFRPCRIFRILSSFCICSSCFSKSFWIKIQSFSFCNWLITS
nr:MAG TPA: hypothetical protein [Crassvirales sp.]